MRTLLFLLFALTPVAGLVGQSASVTSYGAPCPANTAPLATQGLPQLGSTFRATGVLAGQGCTKKACLCTCCPCNDCFGPSLLMLGGSPIQVPIVLPGIGGSGCNLLVTPDLVLPPSPMGDVAIPIPTAPALVGLPFYMQRLDTFWKSTYGSTCAQHTAMLTGFALSDGVQATIGL